LGKVYGNLMVDLNATNVKLRDRAERIVMAVTGLSRPQARRLLARARWRSKTAILMHLASLGFDEARRRLKRSNDSLRRALTDE